MEEREEIADQILSIFNDLPNLGVLFSTPFGVKNSKELFSLHLTKY